MSKEMMICPKAKGDECPDKGSWIHCKPHLMDKTCKKRKHICGQACIPYIPEQPKKPVEPTCPERHWSDECRCGHLRIHHTDWTGKCHCCDEDENPCKCKSFTPADLQPERQVSRDFDTIEHEAEMPLREQFITGLIKLRDAEECPCITCISPSESDEPQVESKDCAECWFDNYFARKIEAHDSAVASAAVKEFAEKVIKEVLSLAIYKGEISAGALGNNLIACANNIRAIAEGGA